MSTRVAFTLLASCLVWLAPLSGIRAATPSAKLLPDTTKGYLSVTDVDTLLEKWEETQLGQLMADPVMKPFAEDLQRQIRAKLQRAGVELGLTWDDLRALYGGELCMAAVQPGHDKNRHALVLLIDVTGHEDNARDLLAKVSRNLADKGARKEVVKIGATELSIYTLPKKAEEIRPAVACHALFGDQLLASNDAEVAAGVLRCIEGEHADTLANVPAFQASMARCEREAGDDVPHIRWFVEPFGYAEVVRAAAGGRKRRGTDMLKVLGNQGFKAIQGVGGHVTLATGKHELLHRTFVYAPPVTIDGRPAPERYELAARMLQFPAKTQADGLTAQSWIPRQLATYGSFNWKMKEAFGYSESLVNEIAGEEVFREVIRAIKEDPNGPQVDIEQGVIAHLAERATIAADYRLPITPKSERLLFAVELTDPDAVAATVNKAMETDPDARKREFEGHVIWEILNEPAEHEVAAPKIDGPGFGSFGAVEEEEEEDVEEARHIPNMAITVAHGHLIVATHVDFVVDMLKKIDTDDTLAEAADYKTVNSMLDELGADQESMRLFTRTDEAYRPTYELIRQGKMPESETLLGKVLNRLLGSDEEGVIRPAEIDGSKLPNYDAVRRYLGPAGSYMQSEEDGWYVAGCVLAKEVLHVAEGSRGGGSVSADASHSDEVPVIDASDDGAAPVIDATNDGEAPVIDATQDGEVPVITIGDEDTSPAP